MRNFRYLSIIVLLIYLLISVGLGILAFSYFNPNGYPVYLTHPGDYEVNKAIFDFKNLS